MDWNFYFNRWLLPLLLTFIFFVYQIYHSKINKFLTLSKNKWYGKFRFLADYCKIKIENLKYFLPIAIIAPIILNILISFLLNIPLTSYGEPLWFSAITSGFLNPISEEFIARGLTLGTFIFISNNFVKGNIKYLFYLFGIIFSSYIFTIGHMNYNTAQFISRFLTSILFSILYLTSNKNLLPPIISHASFNWFLILKDTLNF